MIIQCKSCSRKFIVKDNDIPKSGRMVQCGYCSVTWHQLPNVITTKTKEIKTTKASAIIDDTPSVDKIKASDGKTYRFLGSQWAELLPSGKTGLFARKKISKELDEVTGRIQKKNPRKKQKKLEEVNPSEGINTDKKLPELYKPKRGLGFFGFIFLLIIIAFSVIGVLKTFENELINNFQEAEYIFDLLDQQLTYIAETFKNIFTIIKDLMNSY